MPPKKSPAVRDSVELDTKLHIVRGVRVMLDEDLAELYEVPTKRLNEQVERNKDRFPDDFAFVLTAQEVESLRSQIATSKTTGRGGRRYAPRVFTEQRVAMLSGVLRSPTAVRVNIEIMRAFVRIRRLLATPGELVAQLQSLAETVQLHDKQIGAISDVLRKMLEPPPAPPKRKIGIHPPDPATPPGVGPWKRSANWSSSPANISGSERSGSSSPGPGSPGSTSASGPTGRGSSS